MHVSDVTRGRGSASLLFTSLLWLDTASTSFFHSHPLARPPPPCRRVGTMQSDRFGEMKS
jgi:hypothetical protein